MNEDELRAILKTEPRGYQWAELSEHCEDVTRFLFWEQGVGKTKPVIDNASWLFRENKIDAMLVLAPNGVHYNWPDHELPKHCGVPYRAHAFDNGRDTARVKGYRRELDEFLSTDTTDKLTVLTISYPALLKRTLVDVDDRGEILGGWLVDFVRNRRVLMAADELGMMKNPQGKMSLRARALAAHARYRRGLDGTPVDNGPFDLYAIMLFGDPRFWQKHGIGSQTSFENRYGVFKPLTIKLYDNKSDGSTVVRQRYNPETKTREDAHPVQLVDYKNLDDLRSLIQPWSSRLTKETAGLDLPPKSYAYQPFELTPRQREVYEKLKKEYMVVVDGNLITAPMAMTLLLRLAQTTSGYLPTDPEGTQFVEADPGKNPRLDALVGLVEPMTCQGLMWAAFRPERDAILGALGKRVLAYRSDDSDRQKRDAIEAWRRGDAQFLLGHIKSGLARGHTLTEGTVGIYYSNLYFHGPYCQSEDRMHRIGQHHPVTYYHLSARRTVDQHVSEALRNKMGVAAETLGDRLREWLS